MKIIRSDILSLFSIAKAAKRIKDKAVTAA
jgi:hypothetical protein